MEILVADIGGTHARFAIASMLDGNISLGHLRKMAVADHASIDAALREYQTELPHINVKHAVLAVASPIKDNKAQLTNGTWQFDSVEIATMLDCSTVSLLNDFVSIGHAVARAPSGEMRQCFGPAETNQEGFPVLVVGPGTGLGVSIVSGSRSAYEVIETEGGHIGFSPHSPFQISLLKHLLKLHDRVSVERVASGPSLREISKCLVPDEEAVLKGMDDATLWGLALSEPDSPAGKALIEYCTILGSVIGDMALVTGAKKVVLAGNIANRISEKLSEKTFIDGFCSKGRFRDMMEQLPVMLLTDADSGLQGAAAYFFNQPASRVGKPA